MRGNIRESSLICAACSGVLTLLRGRTYKGEHMRMNMREASLIFAACSVVLTLLRGRTYKGEHMRMNMRESTKENVCGRILENPLSCLQRVVSCSHQMTHA